MTTEKISQAEEVDTDTVLLYYIMYDLFLHTSLKTQRKWNELKGALNMQ